MPTMPTTLTAAPGAGGAGGAGEAVAGLRVAVVAVVAGEVVGDVVGEEAAVHRAAGRGINHLCSWAAVRRVIRADCDTSCLRPGPGSRPRSRGVCRAGLGGGRDPYSRSNYARPASTAPTGVRLPDHNTFTGTSRGGFGRRGCNARRQSGRVRPRRIYLSLESIG